MSTQFNLHFDTNRLKRVDTTPSDSQPDYHLASERQAFNVNTISATDASASAEDLMYINEENIALEKQLDKQEKRNIRKSKFADVWYEFKLMHRNDWFHAIIADIFILMIITTFIIGPHRMIMFLTWLIIHAILNPFTVGAFGAIAFAVCAYFVIFGANVGNSNDYRTPEERRQDKELDRMISRFNKRH